MSRWLSTAPGRMESARGGGLQWAVATLVIWAIAALGVGWISGYVIDVVQRATGTVSVEQAMTILGVTALFGAVGASVATYVLVRKDAAELGRVRARIWTYVVLGFLPIGVLAVGFGLYRAVGAAGGTSEAGVAVLLSAGVIGLLLALAVVAVFFHGLALNDRDEALGLPKGSVRAVIALALILIFAILSVYLYSTIDASNAPKADIAKQLVTTVSTLVVAISSFYFGSNAVQQATNTMVALKPGGGITFEGPASPTITGGPDGWTPSSISYTVHSTPTGADVKGTVTGDKGASLTNQGGVWTYQPTEPEDAVTLRFSVAGDSSVFKEVSISVARTGEPGAGGGSQIVPPAVPNPPGSEASVGTASTEIRDAMDPG